MYKQIVSGVESQVSNILSSRLDKITVVNFLTLKKVYKNNLSTQRCRPAYTKMKTCFVRFIDKSWA